MNIGTYSSVPVMEERLVNKEEWYEVSFPYQTVGDIPLAINPLNGALLRNPTNPRGISKIQSLIDLANSNNIDQINLNISMGL